MQHEKGEADSKLAAVLIADIAGYGRLMEASGHRTHTRLMALRRNVIDPALCIGSGRIVKQTGDGFIAIFDSIRKATLCAVAMQKEIERREGGEPAEWRIRFRMGLHLGDVVEERGDLYGSAVNIAARLQELAEPGAVMLSSFIRDQMPVDVGAPVIDLGVIRLKNIAAPVRVFRLATSIDSVQPRPARLDLRTPPSIAVLPFRVADEDREQSYFGEGIVEDIIGALAGLEDLLVISRNSTLAYRDGNIDLHRIGDALGVRYVLSGSVRRSPRFLRIHAELATTDDTAAVWAQNFDAELGDLLEIQDSITAQIAGMIAPRIRAAEIERAFLKRPESMDAYDHFLQGLSLLFRLGKNDFANAGMLLRRAIALDDSYATSYALTAEWHALRVGQGWSPSPEVDSREAVRLAQAAVDRDPNNVRALSLLGHYKAFLFRDFDGALALFKRGLDLGPNNALAWVMSAPTSAISAMDGGPSHERNAPCVCRRGISWPIITIRRCASPITRAANTKRLPSGARSRSARTRASPPPPVRPRLRMAQWAKRMPRARLRRSCSGSIPISGHRPMPHATHTGRRRAGRRWNSTSWQPDCRTDRIPRTRADPLARRIVSLARQQLGRRSAVTMVWHCMADLEPGVFDTPLRGFGA
jgi:adenylate cyclase